MLLNRLSGVEGAEERISELEDRKSVLQSDQQRKNGLKIIVKRLWDLWDWNERSDILPAIRVPKVDEKEAGAEQGFKDLQVHEAEQTPKRISPKKSTPRPITF